ncbi:hypothetical protein D0T12_23490 [Actinomadura spongiicola]|uniref:Uncharacterized protein n=1 Tax=Actinomadura spongiicola TaxID=2303421 RepID=A0A372GD67_9ACTN|nr:hypothetical protein D0T12_23490 [Actinomadura spongiicola]
MSEAKERDRGTPRSLRRRGSVGSGGHTDGGGRGTGRHGTGGQGGQGGPHGQRFDGGQLGGDLDGAVGVGVQHRMGKLGEPRLHDGPLRGPVQPWVGEMERAGHRTHANTPSCVPVGRACAVPPVTTYP